MRLLNVKTRKLEEFFGDSIPPYAILSHTWGKQEVSLQDLSREGHQQKQGYGKIEGCCRQAIKDRLLWVWVDTCCIDKTSSAELSEAINSMFRWYQHSRVCYAYLQDVPSGTDVYAHGSAFRKSRWFTRGWTLQELLAPQKIEFYDTNWTHILLLNTISYPTTGPVDLISDITSIDYATFRHYNALYSVSSVPAACVFSWMARRSTTRVEDEAYCLLGLLNINMPLLYGEGEKAFIRLQEAILSGSDDISPLAWGYHSPYMRNMSYLARSPAAFIGYPKKYDYRRERIPRIHTTVTGHGLHIELRMILVDKRSKVWLGIVEEGDLGTGTGIAIVLQQIRNVNLFKRVSGCPPVSIQTTSLSRRANWAIRSKQIYIALDSDYRVDSWRTDTRTTLERLLFRTFVYQAVQCEVRFSFAFATRYLFSSSWPPPVSESCLAGEPVSFHFGPTSSVVYIIFANEKQEGFAVRVEIEWGRHGAKVVKPTFCVLTDQHIHTALEHCCGTKLDSKVPQFAKDMHWQHYFAAKNVTTNEIGYVYATDGPRNRRGEIESCDLWWKKGLYS